MNKPFRLQHTYPNAKHVVGQPRSLVYYVFHANTDRRQYSAQLGYAAGSVAQSGVKLDQSSVDRQSSVQTSTQYGRVNVTATKQKDDSESAHTFVSVMKTLYVPTGNKNRNEYCVKF